MWLVDLQRVQRGVWSLCEGPGAGTFLGRHGRTWQRFVQGPFRRVSNTHKVRIGGPQQTKNMKAEDNLCKKRSEISFWRRMNFIMYVTLSAKYVELCCVLPLVIWDIKNIMFAIHWKLKECDIFGCLSRICDWKLVWVMAKRMLKVGFVQTCFAWAQCWVHFSIILNMERVISQNDL